MTPRGLTLIEVLAATVLLSLLAAACLPVLTDSMAVLGRDTPLPDTFGIGRVADQFIADPEVFGMKDFSPRGMDSFELVVPEELRDLYGESVNVQILRADPDDIEHCWLIFESSGVAIARWMKLPPPRNEVGR